MAERHTRAPFGELENNATDQWPTFRMRTPNVGKMSRNLCNGVRSLFN